MSVNKYYFFELYNKLLLYQIIIVSVFKMFKYMDRN